MQEMTEIADFAITRFAFPRDRIIGDSQVRIDTCNAGVLELRDREGRTGTGFFLNLFHPLPDRSELERAFRTEALPGLQGQEPVSLIHRLVRPRGGNNRALPHGFGEAIDQALWDLAAQQVNLPLWRYLGGTSPRVRAYASGLDFHLSNEAYVKFFGAAHALGFRAFKIKVGHPELAWDLNRLRLLSEAVGPGATIMVDANEAWTPKEAIRRLFAYRDAGFGIFWIEDPCPRDDFEGLRQVADAVPFTHLNTGEYLDLSGKRRLIAARAVDILNVHGRISDVLRAGWLAAEHGIRISLGNTFLELGVHLAAALPEADWLEYSFQNYNHLAATPIKFDGEFAIAPDRPGHGLTLSEVARRDHAVETVAEGRRPEKAPPSPIRL
jgi:L-alanine-DL-glutamate epimerase-like enolase superfamily enzyme